MEILETKGLNLVQHLVSQFGLLLVYLKYILSYKNQCPKFFFVSGPFVDDCHKAVLKVNDQLVEFWLCA